MPRIGISGKALCRYARSVTKGHNHAVSNPSIQQIDTDHCFTVWH